ncbi:succinyl-diaminopimelate desuccinylase [Mangrovibrevibacter kandeliae]|uniref:succinyl-diaminopimelate desuccinylase n=1 Tax=Mangrovibrevibacter kandeliae TaxID=2968473 RepID=UPI0021198F9E|nr:succinyl-diaminopimelate desuccinylase [Aurantimonas sp. CSK15Z-1]MCQ8783454.1 succinyl-diaminopimelate desuccinylase [Aurantimonas sp. CSK15Z-1]
MSRFPIDPTSILIDLIRCPSVTPREAGALDALDAALAPLGFTVERPTFHEAGAADVENLFARRGSSGPHLVFAGHTDVVPPGEAGAWRFPPFAGEIADGALYGRGAVDMKGGIACFVAAVARIVDADGDLPGQVSLLITGDEEGPAVNGTVKLLDWARARGERFDACVVGEPTNPDAMGDMIKVGRRGSLSATLTVAGRQGHVAYPHLADNPVRGLVTLLDALMAEPLDAGSERFQPSNLEVTTIDVGNPSTNVIPAEAKAGFNIRFNDRWSVASLKAEIERRLAEAARDLRLRPGKDAPVRYDLVWRSPASDAFFTSDAPLTQTLSDAIEAVTGRRPALSTSGGTSDARFIKDHCPVVEFGLVGQTMHMVDECVALADLESLTRIYETFIRGWFRARA